MVTSDESIPLTQLPLDLLATNLASSSRDSFVTVRHRTSGAQGSYFPGDRLPGAGAIERIEGGSVVFHNPARESLERLSLLPSRETAKSAKKLARTTRGNTRPKTDKSPYSDSVIAIDDTTYEVERSMVSKLISNPSKLGARVRPVQTDAGVGFRLYGVRGTSPLAAIGIRSGDTIEAINGLPMTTDADELLAMYTKLSEARHLSVSVRRRGQVIAMDYRVR